MLVEIDGVTLHLAHPDELTVTWVGQEEVMRQLLAAWLVVDSADVPMNPRLLGKPGVGKTTLAPAAAAHHRFSGAPRGIRDIEGKRPVWRRTDPELRHRVPATGALGRRTL